MSKLDELVEQFPIVGNSPDIHEGKRRISAYIEERFGPLVAAGMKRKDVDTNNTRPCPCDLCQALARAKEE